LERIDGENERKRAMSLERRESKTLSLNPRERKQMEN
jgi:hypothetical protein